ncbi:LIM domain-containing protein [Aquibium oceanicum]|uniref:Uncharacterized protein n=1 Tax=Aquibium oceanicum TaxID=1670800 RepID=A0A1L3SP56_9HYPH|nr:hypothetical protein [Aquibium oceanicum]APH71183.1 hypothetical protein BSQ44_07205 [Aquibium oceanicum]
MLARPEKFRCVECGLAFGQEGFRNYYGKLDNGPAYWCDRGVLCSPACSLAHTQRRAEEGTLPRRPADNPME